MRSCGNWLGVLMVTVLAAATAQAAPARIKVFEAHAHAAPTNESPVVHVFPEGTEVSVSEDVQQGWRRIRLPSGDSGFVRDDQLMLTAGRPAPAPAPVATVGGVVSGHALPPESGQRVTTYVKDLNHFAELVKSDPLVGPRAASMVRTSNIGTTAMLVGVVAGTVLMIGSFTFLAGETCTSYESGVDCMSKGRLPVFLGGAGIAMAGALVPWFTYPRRTDLLDMINVWNGRHPDQQFEITHAPARN